MWWQGAHSDYLWFGDANTRWFQTRASARKTKNTIARLYDSSGVWRFGEEELADIVTCYFGNLFTSAVPTLIHDVLDYVPVTVTSEMNTSVTHPYTREEVEVALKQMHPHKAPGPERKNLIF